MRDEMLFGRPDLLKVFVSSEMRSGQLTAERVAVAKAIEESGMHFAWYWERDADAGPFSSEGICLGQSRTSDCFILILGEKLTEITSKEYTSARRSGAHCIIFTKVGCTRDPEAEQFIEQERQHVTYKPFSSTADLRSVVTAALVRHAVQAARRDQMSRHPAVADPPKALWNRLRAQGRR